MNRDFQISAIRLFLQHFKNILDFYNTQEQCEKETIEQLFKVHKIISDNVERIIFWGNDHNIDEMHQKIYERYGITNIQKFEPHEKIGFPNEFNYTQFIELYARNYGYNNDEHGENLENFIMNKLDKFKKLMEHRFIIALHNEEMFLIDHQTKDVKKIENAINNLNYQVLHNLLNNKPISIIYNIGVADIDTCRLIASVNQLEDICMTKRNSDLINILFDLKRTQYEILSVICRDNSCQEFIRNFVLESSLILLFSGVLFGLSFLFFQTISMYMMISMIGALGSILICGLTSMVLNGISTHLNNCADLTGKPLIPDLSSQEYPLLCRQQI
jgi:hypothetical protein